ncbi:MAG: hypothetical protein SF051_05155 [Elusimicrobiota bacterium]|nr:hypothetical protein [Elusimicrobiota bacterium]
MTKQAKKGLSILCCCVLMSGALAPAHALTVRAPRVAAPAANPGVAAAVTGLQGRLNPAFPGGVSLNSGLLATPAPLAAPARPLLTPAPLPAAAVPVSARVSVAGPASAAPADAPRAAAPRAALEAVEGLAAGLAPREGEAAGSARAEGLSHRFFDLAAPNDGAASDAASIPGMPEAPEPASNHPRVVFLLDVFQGPVSDRFARYLDTLVDQKVQVVVLTDRPESGPGSIGEILLSKLKAKRANGVIVVANNGAKIFAYSSSRSKQHQPLVPNAPGFPEQALATFASLNAELAAKFGVPAAVETRYEDGKGKTLSTLSYSLSLPRELSEKASAKSNKLRADLWVAALNARLAKDGVPYTFELFVDAAGGLSAVTHATPLRGSLGRIREALKVSLNGQDFLADHPEKTLIIADPAWWKNFQRQPELKSVNFLGAKTAADAEAQVGAMLGDLSLQKVYVDRYMVESYVRWKHYQSYRTEGEDLDAPAGRSGGFGGGGARSSKDGREMGPMYLWRAAVVSKILELMGKELRDGSWEQLKDQTLDSHVRTLYKGKALQAGTQVYMPFQNEAVAAARGNSLWAKYSATHLQYTQRFIRNLKKSLLPAFPMDVRDFAETIHRLGSEAMSRTTLMFRNMLTGRMYTVGTRVPLSRLDMTPEGQTFVAHVPRTGKRVPEVDDFTAKMMALALLKADGVVAKADGTWEVNHLPLKQVRVDFHYYRVTIPYVFTPQDLVGVELEVTSAIEKMLADEAFIKHYEETMGERDKAKAEAKAKKAAAAKKTGARAAAKPEAKKPAPAPRRRTR